MTQSLDFAVQEVIIKSYMASDYLRQMGRYFGAFVSAAIGVMGIIFLKVKNNEPVMPNSAGININYRGKNL